jgi:hypothetical protein
VRKFKLALENRTRLVSMLSLAALMLVAGIADCAVAPDDTPTPSAPPTVDPLSIVKVSSHIAAAQTALHILNYTLWVGVGKAVGDRCGGRKLARQGMTCL